MRTFFRRYFTHNRYVSSTATPLEALQLGQGLGARLAVCVLLPCHVQGPVHIRALVCQHTHARLCALHLGVHVPCRSARARLQALAWT
jgi:hypothetical protein